MSAQSLSPDDLQARADNVRDEIGATLDKLRVKLRPRNLVDDFAERSGFRDIDASSIFEYAAKRHPIATLAVAASAGLSAYFLLKSRPGEMRPSVLREVVGSFSASARKTFKSRADAKREQFMRSAEAHLAAGADQLSDAVEKGVGELISRVPAPPEAKPLIESAVQIIVIATLDSLLAKVWK